MGQRRVFQAFFGDIVAVARCLREKAAPPPPKLPLPGSFHVPHDVQWPEHLRGQILDITKLRRMFKKNQVPESIFNELNALGFVWDVSSFNHTTRLEALKAYKNIHGHLVVPRQFIVPENDQRWPRDTWGWQLGKLVHNIRFGNVKIDKKAVDDIGFVWDPMQNNWELNLKALKQYKALHGHVCVPQRFVVPVNEKNQWPDRNMENIPLGRFVNSLRLRELTKEKQKELDDIGFVSNAIEYEWERKIQALRQYKRIFNHLVVPKSFVIPANSQWQKPLHGLKLGEIVRSIRNSPVADSNIPSRQREELDEIGFVWDPLSDHWDTVMLAIKIYQQNYGHLRIPTKFIVPKGEEWPKETWFLHLGSAVTQLRHRFEDMSSSADQSDMLAMLVTLLEEYRLELSTFFKLAGVDELHFRTVSMAQLTPDSVHELFEKLTVLRHHFHQNAEVTWKEFKTQRTIRD
ncbi:hypothetical protein THRCLA_21246 [Thraustotheca clavata]|uniref:Helicase-associated domain-containing protein n=1 Tax=Thraustotheca clavata TaxID=74557 RepID=A0A1V9ZZ79_9STRA|nr:hypothetical protein THRCLA_21246 [Thraustotheca clavata]